MIMKTVRAILQSKAETEGLPENALVSDEERGEDI